MYLFAWAWLFRHTTKLLLGCVHVACSNSENMGLPNIWVWPRPDSALELMCWFRLFLYSAPRGFNRCSNLTPRRKFHLIFCYILVCILNQQSAFVGLNALKFVGNFLFRFRWTHSKAKGTFRDCLMAQTDRTQVARHISLRSFFTKTALSCSVLVSPPAGFLLSKKKVLVHEDGNS